MGQRTAWLALLVILSAALAVIVVVVIPGEDKRPENHVLSGRGKTVTVYSKVTSGPKHLREDDQPLRLFFSPMLCVKKSCVLPGAVYQTGDDLKVVCQTSGDRLTNGNDSAPDDDRNPGLFESKRWYGVRTDLGRFAYFNEIWAEPKARGGLGLPQCSRVSPK